MPTNSDACLFCDPPKAAVWIEHALAYVLWDAFPVTPNHCLVIPTRHVVDLFGLSPEEILECHALLGEGALKIRELDPNVVGFNVGLNAGEAAGQTIFHCHFHLIPRRANDVSEPRGGVRHTIPGKGSYSP